MGGDDFFKNFGPDGKLVPGLVNKVVPDDETNKK